MRRTRLVLVTIAILAAAAPAGAQQGSVQVVAASQVTTGDPASLGAFSRFQPDFGVRWFQPTRAWGTVTFDAHAVRGENDPRLGRALFSVSDLKRKGLTWKVSLGDTAYTPFLADYGFNNLFAPQVTFRGGSVAASGADTSLSLTAGRVTVFRDLFGADADTLGQSLLVARASHKISQRVELVAHASRVRTEDLKGFSYLIESSDDTGAGVRVNLTGTLQVIADAGLTSYRRKDATTWERKPSVLVGTRWSGKQGWFQVDAHRFSPGNFSVLNNPYTDREGLFAGGEYNFSRFRLFGGWDLFGNDRQSEPTTSWNNGSSSRAYGGARLRVNSHLSVGGRIDRGARVSRPSAYSVGYESDTGSASADWQVAFKRINVTGRYLRRSDVDAGGGMNRGRSAEDDVSGQLFLSLSRSTRVYTTLFRTERRDQNTGDLQMFWQASAGAQFQVGSPGVAARAEVIVGRERQMRSDFLTPRTAFSGGFNAQIARHVSLSLDIFANRSPVVAAVGGPWTSRTIGRLVYTMPTGTPSSAASGASPSTAARTPRGNETIEGTVFVDWNSNGVLDAGEEALPEVRVVLDNGQGANADASGRFRFEHVDAGRHVLAIDVATVPADFDLPAAKTTDLTIRRDVMSRITFGVLPVGDIQGIILRDSNGNGRVDESDEPMDGTVLVLDDGPRTEVARKGLFTFSGVRMGTHTVHLLVESLGEQATVTGARDLEVRVTRDAPTPIAAFLVAVDKRPEIRKVFPKRPDAGRPDGGGPARSGGRVNRAPARGGASRSGVSTGHAGGSSSGNSRSSESRNGDSRTGAGSSYGTDKANFRSSR